MWLWLADFGWYGTKTQVLLKAYKDQILWNLWSSGTQKHQIFIGYKSRSQMEARSEPCVPATTLLQVPFWWISIVTSSHFMPHSLSFEIYTLHNQIQNCHKWFERKREPKGRTRNYFILGIARYNMQSRAHLWQRSHCCQGRHSCHWHLWNGRLNAKLCGEHHGTEKVINPAYHWQCHGKIVILLILTFLGQTIKVALLPACKKQILWNLWSSGTQKYQIFIGHWEQESNGNEV